MSKKTSFHGILAVGRSRADAVNKYRLLALSKGATVQVDEGREIAFVTHANEANGMFNPMSGNMDLETDDTMLDKIEFQANSSGTVDAHHLYCASGCGAHVVFDSEALVKFCPNCTSSLSEDESEEDESEEDESEEELEADESDEESDESEEEESDEESDESEESDSEESDEFEEDESSESSEGLIVAAASFEEARKMYIENLPSTSVSSGDDEVEAHHQVCSDENCGAHVISTSAAAECPVCMSALCEAADEEVADDEGAEESDEDEGAEEGSEESADDAEESADTEEAGADAETDKEEAKPAEEAPAIEELTDDDGEVVISAASFAEALDQYKASKSGISTSAEAFDVNYVVCSSKECGQHIISESGVSKCPICASSVEEPEEEPEESEDTDSEDNTLSLTDTEGNVLTEETEDLDAMADVEETAEASDLDVSYSSSVAGKSVWTAFYKGMPVAMCSKQDAGKNSDLFDTPSFGQAALATAKVAGVRKALNELGFKGITHKVSVSAEVKRMVDKQVAESRQSISSEQSQFKDAFMAALATAAIGINRGFFTEDRNPIKEALWNAMSSAGIRSPEALIDTAFKSHSDAYHKALFARATDIVSKPLDVQESLAKAILGTTYQAVSSESAADNIESRLSTIGTSVSSEQNVEPAAADTGRQQIQRVVQGLGRKSAR